MPDVIIIEAKMGGLDAAGLIRELKKSGELPVVIVTADYDMPNAEKTAAFSHICHPFSQKTHFYF